MKKFKMIRKARLKDVPVLVKLVVNYLGRGAKRKEWFIKLCIKHTIEDKKRGLVLVSNNLKGAVFVDLWKEKKHIHVELMISPSKEVTEEFYRYLMQYCKKNKLLFITASTRGNQFKEFFEKKQMYYNTFKIWVKNVYNLKYLDSPLNS